MTFSKDGSLPVSIALPIPSYSFDGANGSEKTPKERGLDCYPWPETAKRNPKAAAPLRLFIRRNSGETAARIQSGRIHQ